MHQQMVDLAHPNGAVLLRLVHILDPQLVQDANRRIVLELAVQVVRHLPFRCGPGALAGGLGIASARCRA